MTAGEYGPVGPYELSALVASTPTGEVWRGHDPVLHRDVALKHVTRASAAAADVLRREAQLLASLPHPNIVTVIDLIERDDGLWLVQEWIDGATLAVVVREGGRLTGPQGTGVVRGALLGLAEAHSRGVVHGDVSPTNVLLDRTGTSRLIDFGVSAPVGSIGAFGTPGFLSPEAAYGLPLTPRSDVYSASALLTYLLRGRAFFTGPTAEAVIASQLQPVLPALDVPAPFEPLLRSSLAADPALRPPDAPTLLALLDEAAEQTYGPDWRAAAGVAGLVGVAMGATAALLSDSGTAATAPATTPSAGQIGGSAARSAARHVGGRSPSQSILTSPAVVGAAAVVAVVAVIAGTVAVTHRGRSATPVAATAASTSPTVDTQAVTASPEVTPIDWQSVSLPVPMLQTAFAKAGSACASEDLAAAFPSGRATFSNGAAQVGFGGMGVTEPVYGQLGPTGTHVALMPLNCSAGGTAVGLSSFVVVLDPTVTPPTPLAVLQVPGAGSTRVAVADGTARLSWKELGPNDPACCPSRPGSGTLTDTAGTLAGSWPNAVVWSAAASTPIAGGATPSVSG